MLTSDCSIANERPRNEEKENVTCNVLVTLHLEQRLDVFTTPRSKLARTSSTGVEDPFLVGKAPGPRLRVQCHLEPRFVWASVSFAVHGGVRGRQTGYRGCRKEMPS